MWMANYTGEFAQAYRGDGSLVRRVTGSKDMDKC